jgi:hypothetical protein
MWDLLPEGVLGCLPVIFADNAKNTFQNPSLSW